MATVKAYDVAAGRRYSVRYVKPDGRQGRKSGFHTAEAARDWAHRTEIKKNDGEYVDPALGKTTVAAIATPWLRAQKSRLKPASYRAIESRWETHVEPRWAGIQISAVHTTDVEDWIAWMQTEIRDDKDAVTKKKLGANTVRGVVAVLSQIVDRAVRDRLIPANRVTLVENLPRRGQKRRMYLTHQQVADLADHAGGWHSTLIVTLAYSGLRWGEVVGLRVSDLDLLRRRIHVRQNVVQIGARFEPGTPKTHRSRTVAIPLFLVEQLARQAEGKQRDDPLFARDDGGWIRRPKDGRGWFARAAEQAGVAGLTPHDLRHTAASLAVQAGANVKAVQRMLGHASAAMTLDTYADLFDDDLDSVASALDSARARSLA